MASEQTIKKVLIGMSGGVDSSVAALLLQEQGWQVSGISLMTGDAAESALEGASAVCRQIGIAWTSLDVSQAFASKIVHEFQSAYLNGITPNPCVFCNPLVKFQAILDEADRRECPYIASGHYARILRWPDTGRLALARVTDDWKDQSYFLYRLTQEQLARLILPLAGMNKDDVRQIARTAGLLQPDGRSLGEKSDSQDICFIPHGNYADFIRSSMPPRGSGPFDEAFQPGAVVNMLGQHIGTHDGLIYYTIGQRKGFHVQTTERLFVIAKNRERNELVVGAYEEIMKREITVYDLVYSALSFFSNGERLDARIRSSAHEVPSRVFPQADGTLRVIFDQPVAAPAPGQSCVFYRDGVIMGGGVIA